MSGQEISVFKIFNFSFVLDRPKLCRILTILDTRFREFVKNPVVEYNLTLAKGKALSSSEMEGLFDQDNTVKNPINNLSIIYKGKENDAEHSCTIIFDRKDSEVILQIHSPNGRLANELFAELEEQVERTQVHKTIYTVKRGRNFHLLAILMLVVLTVIMTFLGDLMKPRQFRNFLANQDIDRLSAIVDTVSDQDGKLNFVYEMHLAQLTNAKKASALLFPIKADLRLFLVLCPGIAIILVLIYIFSVCYPGSIFLWGDYAEHYENLVARRRFLWNAIIIALFVGIVGNLFVYGISQYWQPK
jgi:hypothetical protein